MALPAQVKKQIKAGNKAYETVYGDDKEVAKPKSAEESPSPEPQPIEEPAETPAPVGEPEGEPASAPEVKPAAEEPDYEQKFKVLKGKYDSEVPQLHAQLREMGAQMQKLQEKLDTA